MLRSDLEPCTIEIKDLKLQIDHSSLYSVLSPSCEMCGSLKVAYLTSRLERTVVSKKMIEDDLSQVEESATKSTYELGVGFERYEDKGEKSATITKRKQQSNPPKLTTHPTQSHLSSPREK
jgi:DNA-directed RNA polymerase beta' subunit